ncbi:NADH dehydrogenase [ubiquinone] 1 beta subcomplex subunit 4-like [Rhinopithecus roxellana]|uniref:NADH dehydrogenase [ubiquinone] 1 beta subcomplex subunit 4-like n=1 Tax=Rhinopithecus roxellana TaxID=61622 RepID=UPI00123755D7|nr:NADH dehydrogenase [ubiquinone] 1 beta subcomplex subunit 4-like [Rhinopithecus roxellana]
MSIREEILKSEVYDPQTVRFKDQLRSSSYPFPLKGFLPKVRFKERWPGPLKREYLLQYNDPNRRGLIENPALLRWTYARTTNVYPNFRPTPKNSLMGALFGIGPLIFLYCIIKTDRDRKEKLIREGKLDRTFQLSR